MSRVVMKRATFKTPNLVKLTARQNAEGKNCTLRLAGCCNEISTVVLAHLRMFGWAGMGHKPPDFLALFACGHCHALLDARRTDLFGHDDILCALGETLIQQFNDGIFQ